MNDRRWVSGLALLAGWSLGHAAAVKDRAQGEPVPLERIYPWLAAETVGLGLAADKAATISAVAPGRSRRARGFARETNWFRWAGSR